LNAENRLGEKNDKTSLAKCKNAKNNPRVSKQSPCSEHHFFEKIGGASRRKSGGTNKRELSLSHCQSKKAVSENNTTGTENA